MHRTVGVLDRLAHLSAVGARCVNLRRHDVLVALQRVNRRLEPFEQDGGLAVDGGALALVLVALLRLVGLTALSLLLELDLGLEEAVEE